MSRNLGRISCAFCPAVPVLEEPPRPITKGDARGYFSAYEGMLVARATCPACEAKYLAWVDASKRARYAEPRDPVFHETGFFDLSHRSSFDDEPGEEDLPNYDVKTELVRTGPYSGHWSMYFAGVNEQQRLAALSVLRREFSRPACSEEDLT